MTDRPITADDLKLLGEIYTEGFDASLMKSIVYFDGWAGYEESGGMVIFRGIDDSLQITEYGTWVTSTEASLFQPRDITPEEAEKAMEEMDKLKLTGGGDFPVM